MNFPFFRRPNPAAPAAPLSTVFKAYFQGPESKSFSFSRRSMYSSILSPKARFAEIAPAANPDEAMGLSRTIGL